MWKLTFQNIYGLEFDNLTDGVGMNTVEAVEYINYCVSRGSILINMEEI